MQFTTNKEKGNAGLGIAIGFFSSHGYTVSIPLNDTQDYDIVREKGHHIDLVQVKATGFKTKFGIYQVNLRSFGGTKGLSYKTLIETKIDYLFIVTENMDLYFIPSKVIENKNCINLGEKYNKYKVKFVDNQK